MMSIREQVSGGGTKEAVWHLGEPVPVMAGRVLEVVVSSDERSWLLAMMKHSSGSLGGLTGRPAAPALEEASAAPVKKKLTLFEIDERLETLMDTIDGYTEPEEVPAELTAAVRACLEEYRDKVDRVWSYGRSLKVLVDNAKDEEDRVSRVRKSAENKLSRLKGFLLEFMRDRSLKHLRGETSTIRRQDNSVTTLVVDKARKAVEANKRPYILDVFHIHRELVGEIMEVLLSGDQANLCGRLLSANRQKPFVDTQKIRAEIEAGGAVEGYSLEKGEHVRIA